MFEDRANRRVFWALNLNASTIRILDDRTTVTPLKRAVIELEFNLR